MAHDVFISYSSEDKQTADAICGILEADGIRCWIAPRDVRDGADYAESIVDGIIGSRILILVFSSHANSSPHVPREVERAVHHGLHIISFRVEDVAMSKSLEYFVSSSHWLDALTPPMKSHIQRLAEAIRFLLDKSRSAHPVDSGIPVEKISADHVPAKLTKTLVSRKNVIFTGPPGLNKPEFLLKVLTGNHPALASDLMDLLYVQDFQNPSRAALLILPAGHGIKLKKDLKRLVEETRTSLAYLASSEEYTHRQRQIKEAYQGNERRSRLVDLNRNVLSLILGDLMDEAKYQDPSPSVSEFLEGAKQRLVELNAGADSLSSWKNKILKGSEELDANLLVDNSGVENCPVVFEVTSSERSLIGAVEHIAAERRPPFIGIVPGALYRANGGILVLNGNDSYIQDHGLRILKKGLFEKLLPQIPAPEGLCLAIEQPGWNVVVLLYIEEKLIGQLSKKEPELGTIFQTIINVS